MIVRGTRSRYSIQSPVDRQRESFRLIAFPQVGRLMQMVNVNNLFGSIIGVFFVTIVRRVEIASGSGSSLGCGAWIAEDLLTPEEVIRFDQQMS